MPFDTEDIENMGRAINRTARRIFYWGVGIVGALVVIAVLVGWALG